METEGLSQQELSLIKWVEEQLDIDRHRLLQRYPFVGNFLMRVCVEAGFWDDVPTACTNGKDIHVNVLFYQGLSEEERLFVLAHEAFHCIMLHFQRIQKRDQSLWNIATDLEIHFLLTSEGMVAPFVLPHEKSWKGLSAEQIYEILKKVSEPKDPPPGKGDGKGSSQKDSKKKGPKFGSGLRESEHIKSSGETEGGLKKGFDSFVHGGKNPNNSERFDPDEVQQEVLDKVKASIEVAERSRGFVPGAVKGLVSEMSKREINWRILLSQFITSCYSGERRWLPPERRHIYRGLYLPSVRSESLRAVVAIDTSGSCIEDLPKFFSELTGLLGSFGRYELTVIQCDAEVQSVEKFSDGSPVPPGRKWEGRGFGGTSFVPVFRYLQENCPEVEPSCLIYFTDGYGDAPKDPPGFPVLWILTSDGTEDFCKWGTKVRFRRERG